MSTPGEKLHKLREEHDMSMQELADLVGVHKGTIFKWEHDQVPLRKAARSSLERLPGALRVTPEELIGIESSHPVDYVAHTADGQTYLIEAKTAGPATVPTDMARLYCLDILALQNGFRIEYTAEGDVLLIKGAKVKQVTEAELLTVMDELTRMAGFSLRRLMGGES